MSLDLEMKVLELEERNKFLRNEYVWIWNQYKALRESVKELKCQQTV